VTSVGRGVSEEWVDSAAKLGAHMVMFADPPREARIG
jgi:hypothetical protein